MMESKSTSFSAIAGVCYRTRARVLKGAREDLARVGGLESGPCAWDVVFQCL
jgi:hypothetical protein